MGFAFVIAGLDPANHADAPYEKVVEKTLSNVILIDTGNVKSFAPLLFEKVNYSRRKLSRLSRFESFGALYFLPAIFGCFRAQKKAF